MARVHEVSYVVRRIGGWEFAKRVYKETSQDGVFNMAAAVAFYWLLALLPLIIFLLTLAPLMPSSVKDDAKLRITTWIRLNLADQAAEPIIKNMNAVLETPRGGLLSIGLLATLWAASNGINATMTALDRCYDITKPRHFLLQRAVAIAITLAFVIGTLLVVLLIPVATNLLKLMQVAGPSPNEHGLMVNVREWLSRASEGLLFVINLGRYMVGLALIMCVVSIVYQFGGSVRRRWTFITPGAVFTVLGIMVLSYGFNLYIQHVGASSYDKTYGTLGGVVILLLTLYLYACVFLIGAEINSEIDYVILGSKSAEPTDPLPRLHPREDLERFRMQLLARQESPKF